MVWIERASEIADEYYAAVVFDRSAKKPPVMPPTPRWRAIQAAPGAAQGPIGTLPGRPRTSARRRAAPHTGPAPPAREPVLSGLCTTCIHDSTSLLTPVCYLQDLYVDPTLRAGGVGKQLIDWLVAKMRTEGWSRLYWNTKENNYRARGLYDKFTPRDPFIRYTINKE